LGAPFRRFQFADQREDPVALYDFALAGGDHENDRIGSPGFPSARDEDAEQAMASLRARARASGQTTT